MSEFLMVKGPWLLAASIVAIVVGRLVLVTYEVIREHSRRQRRLDEFFYREESQERVRRMTEETRRANESQRPYL